MYTEYYYNGHKITVTPQKFRISKAGKWYEGLQYMVDIDGKYRIWFDKNGRCWKLNEWCRTVDIAFLEEVINFLNPKVQEMYGIRFTEISKAKIGAYVPADKSRFITRPLSTPSKPVKPKVKKEDHPKPLQPEITTPVKPAITEPEKKNNMFLPLIVIVALLFIFMKKR